MILYAIYMDVFLYYLHSINLIWNGCYLIIDYIMPLFLSSISIASDSRSLLRGILRKYCVYELTISRAYEITSWKERISMCTFYSNSIIPIAFYSSRFSNCLKYVYSLVSNFDYTVHEANR